MNIHGKKVVLRAPEIQDAPLLHKWANDPEIWSNLGGWNFPYASFSTENWISKINNSSLTGHVFCIGAGDAGLIGTANIINIDWKNRNAFHGMMLGDKNTRGKGFGRDAVMAIMRYAFDELGLMRLDGDMIETNTQSINFYTNSCGWEIEGQKKKWFYRSGKYHDKIVVGITREKYYKFIEEKNYWQS